VFVSISNNLKLIQILKNITEVCYSENKPERSTMASKLTFLTISLIVLITMSCNHSWQRGLDDLFSGIGAVLIEEPQMSTVDAQIMIVQRARVDERTYIQCLDGSFIDCEEPPRLTEYIDVYIGANNPIEIMQRANMRFERAMLRARDSDDRERVCDELRRSHRLLSNIVEVLGNARLPEIPKDVERFCRD
jgi:hypothetical protein